MLWDSRMAVSGQAGICDWIGTGHVRLHHIWRKGADTLVPGATIFAPRDVPHCWANTAATESKMIMACTPGGFEGFFEESAKAMVAKSSPAQMDEVMTKFGCELVGPPLFT